MASTGETASAKETRKGRKERKNQKKEKQTKGHSKFSLNKHRAECSQLNMFLHDLLATFCCYDQKFLHFLDCVLLKFQIAISF
jgi:hypothetical protein